MFAAEPSTPPEAPGLIEAIRRYRVLTVALTVAGCFLGLLIAALPSDSSTAIGKIFLSDPRGAPLFSSGGAPQVDFARYASDRASFASSTLVLQGVLTKLPKGTTIDELRKKCESVPATAANEIDITCEFPTAKTAIAAVNGIIEQYRLATKAQIQSRADASLQVLQEERDRLTSTEASPEEATPAAAGSGRAQQLDAQMSEIRSTAASFGDGTDYAEPGREPIATGLVMNLVKNGLIGLAIGLILAVIISWFRADRSPIAASSRDVASMINLPILGEIPRDLIAQQTIELVGTPDSAFQRVASNLNALQSDGLVLFTPIEPLPGHEDVVISTALVAARSGKRVLLIDADIGNRGVSRVMGLPSGAGLTDFVAGTASAEQVTVRVTFDRAQAFDASALHIMGPGSEGSALSSLFRSGRTAEALSGLRDLYEMVIIDGPPLLTSAGSTALGQVVDGVVLMVEGGTPSTSIQDARRQLAFLTSETLGFVFVHED